MLAWCKQTNLQLPETLPSIQFIESIRIADYSKIFRLISLREVWQEFFLFLWLAPHRLQHNYLGWCFILNFWDVSKPSIIYWWLSAIRIRTKSFILQSPCSESGGDAHTVQLWQFSLTTAVPTFIRLWQKTELLQTKKLVTVRETKQTRVLVLSGILLLYHLKENSVKLFQDL